MHIQKQDAYERHTSNKMRNAILFDAIKVKSLLWERDARERISFATRTLLAIAKKSVVVCYRTSVGVLI